MGHRVIRRNRFIACEEVNPFWDEPQVYQFDIMVASNKTIVEIGKHFKRPKSDILMLALDRCDHKTFRELIGQRWG